MPVKGRLRADKPRLDSVHHPVHPREQRRGSCFVQGADGREGSLAEENPRATRRVMSGGSVCLERPHHGVCHQAPYGRLLRAAACTGVLRPVRPAARHGAAGSAKRGGWWGSGRKHVQEVRNGRGVPQVHVDPQEGGARWPLVAV